MLVQISQYNTHSKHVYNCFAKLTQYDGSVSRTRIWAGAIDTDEFRDCNRWNQEVRGKVNDFKLELIYET